MEAGYIQKEHNQTTGDIVPNKGKSLEQLLNPSEHESSREHRQKTTGEPGKNGLPVSVSYKYGGHTYYAELSGGYERSRDFIRDWLNTTYHVYGLHGGLDIVFRTKQKAGVPRGVVPVYATHSGKLSKSGTTIFVTSGNVRTVYAHMTKLIGNKKTVKAGDIVGYISDTGGAKGKIHLHYEIQYKRGAIGGYMNTGDPGVFSFDPQNPHTTKGKWTSFDPLPERRVIGNINVDYSSVNDLIRNPKALIDLFNKKGVSKKELMDFVYTTDRSKGLIEYLEKRGLKVPPPLNTRKHFEKIDSVKPNHEISSIPSSYQAPEYQEMPVHLPTKKRSLIRKVLDFFIVLFNL